MLPQEPIGAISLAKDGLLSTSDAALSNTALSNMADSGGRSSSGRLSDIPDPFKVVKGNPEAKALWNATAVATSLNLEKGNVEEMCRLLLPEGAETIAIVGNGPLTDRNRAAIAEADSVLRFNELNNRLPYCRPAQYA